MLCADAIAQHDNSIWHEKRLPQNAPPKFRKFTLACSSSQSVKRFQNSHGSSQHSQHHCHLSYLKDQIGMGWKLLAHHVSSAFFFCCKLRWPSEQRLCRWEPFAQASSVSCFWRLLVRKVLCNFSTAQPFLVSCPVINHVGPRCPLQTIRNTST